MKYLNIPIAVGLSGGVDSSVSALLLKNQGAKVQGLFMQNWEVDNDDPYCSAEQDMTDARKIAAQLEIPFHVVNFAKQYWQNVFQYCLDEFARGRTPNPDTWCNKEIKFKVFLEHALAQGVDYLATGHYVRKREVNGRWQLLKGLDPSKDQSYFLYALGQYELAHAVFPVGELQKSAVRELAREHALVTHAKKDSTGICFIGERKFKDFLKEFLLAQPGLIETPDGQVIGEHDGVMFYTLGQRKGLHIGGKRDAAELPWFVAKKDVGRNVLVVVQGHDHPLLFQDSLECRQVNWIDIANDEIPERCAAKTRYRQADQTCRIEVLGDDHLRVHFDVPQRAITPGQAVVFYQGEHCLGGAIIA